MGRNRPRRPTAVVRAATATATGIGRLPLPLGRAYRYAAPWCRGAAVGRVTATCATCVLKERVRLFVRTRCSADRPPTAPLY